MKNTTFLGIIVIVAAYGLRDFLRSRATRVTPHAQYRGTRLPMWKWLKTWR